MPEAQLTQQSATVGDEQDCEEEDDDDMDDDDEDEPEDVDVWLLEPEDPGLKMVDGSYLRVCLSSDYSYQADLTVWCVWWRRVWISKRVAPASTASCAKGPDVCWCDTREWSNWRYARWSPEDTFRANNDSANESDCVTILGLDMTGMNGIGGR